MCTGYNNKLDSAALFCMLKVFTLKCIEYLFPFSSGSDDQNNLKADKCESYGMKTNIK